MKSILRIVLTAFILLFLFELFFLVVSSIHSIVLESLLSLVKLILILLSLYFLATLQKHTKNEFYHLNDKFLKVFNTSPHGMMIVKISDATIKEVNRAFERVSGYSAEDVVGKSVLELGLWDQPEQRNEMLAILLKYHSFGPVEFKFIPKTGIPTKYTYSAQLIIINGENYLVSHIEEKHDKSSSGNEAKILLGQSLREIMSKEQLYKIPRLTLADLAEKLDTNKTYLSQVINREYGNFNEYVNKFRVMEACRMIQEGLDPRLSIDHLFSEVGFSSRTTFYEAFKKVTGVSPTQYRQINFNPVLPKSKPKI